MVFAQLSAIPDCTVEQQVPLAGYTSFRVGGPAEYFVTVDTVAAAKTLLDICRAHAIPSLLLGNGSNLLIADSGFNGVVWRFSPTSATCTLCDDGVSVRVSAGMPLGKLCRFAAAQALTGLEFAFGIPGSVGGAVYMNAGAYDGQMADIVDTVELITQNGEFATVSGADMAFGYRHSACMETGAVVTAVTFKLTRGDKAAIDEKMQALLTRRRDKQPLEYPSAGSFFKRPVGYFAGKLIEDAGLKGYTVGGAQVSEKHAGFVINLGNATARDIVTLERDVSRIVFEKYGVVMEPEVRYIGDFEED